MCKILLTNVLHLRVWLNLFPVRFCLLHLVLLSRSVLKVVVMEVVTDFIEEVRNGKPAPVGEVIFENLIKTFWCEKIIFKNVKIMNFWC